MTAGPPSRRTRAIFIGTGSFGLEALRMLAEPGGGAGVELAGVVTTPGRPAGRRASIAPSPVEAEARRLSVGPIVSLASLRSPDAIGQVLALAPALIVLADDGRIVPRALLAVPHGALNLHPSLLPRHRGAAPIPATILAGDAVSGVTIIRMDDGIDTGPIVAVERVRLTGTETSPELENRLARLGAGLLERTLPPWLDGRLAARPQPSGGATMTRQLRREDGNLDPRQPAAHLERQVRALAPWPGTFAVIPAGRVLIHAAQVAPREPGDVTGRIAAHGAGLAVVASDGRLVLVDVQLAGGRRMSGTELRRGRPALVGMVLS